MPAIDLDYMKTAWANQTYFQLVIPPMNMTINTLRYKVGAACAGACATVWSFYDADKNRITSSDVITDQTTGWKGTTFSAPPTLSAWNIYYVTVSNNDAAWRILCVNHTWDITEALRSTANPRVGTAQNQHTGSGTSITAPATLGTLTQGDGSIGMPAFFVLSR